MIVKKLRLMILLSLVSVSMYGQLALEGFESQWTGSPAAPPGGWVVYNEIGNTTWVRTTLGFTSTPPHLGNHAAYLDRENVNPGAPIPTNWLITPQFNCPDKGLLHFYSRLTFPGDQGTIYKIMIAPVSNPATAVTALPWVELVPPLSELQLNPSQQEYVEKTINIPAAYTGQEVRIAFIMKGDQQDRWLIDDVEVVSKCDAPINLEVVASTLTTADLKWASPLGVNSWEIEVIQDWQAQTGTGQIYSGILPYHKTDLLANTAYKYYVRSICTGGGKSEWAGPYNFKTPAIGDKCSDPIVLPAVLPVSITDNTVNFGNNYIGIPGTGCGTPGTYLNGNDVVYSYTPLTTGSININLSSSIANAGVFVYSDCANIGINCLAGAVPVSSTSGAIIPTLPVVANTTYYIVVSSSSATVPYTLSIQQVNCNAPTGLAVSAITPTSANLSWASGTAASWQMVVQNQGMGLPMGSGQNVTQNTNVNVTSTSAGVPLTQATNYEYYVRANCGDGTYSIWSGPFAFSTTQTPVTLAYTENFDGNIAHGWYLSNGTQANKWVVGSATSNSFTNSLYISENNGNTNTYNLTSTSVVHAYRDIQIPAGTNLISVSFDLKSGGEVNDYVRAWLVPTTFTPTPGQQVATNSGGTSMGGDMYLTPGWTTQNLVFNVASGGTSRRLIFEWRNNGSAGTQPAAAIDNIIIKVVTCSAPTALTLSNTTQSSATYTWTAPAGTAPAGYEYYYSLNNTPPTAATAALGSVTGVTTATISPLTSSNTYYVWVRSNCGTDKSFWTGPVSVTIPQVPATLDYSENFDGGAHNFVFNNATGTNKWIVGTSTSNSPSKSLYVADFSDTNYFSGINTICHAYRDVLIPSTAKEISITFDYKIAGDISDYMRVWMVPASFIPTANTIIAPAADRVQLGTNFYNSPDWTTVSYNIPVIAYQGQQRRLVFEWRNDSGTGIQPPAAIDNINITVANCPKPTTLTVTNVTNTMATLDWTEVGSATNWEVAYMPAANAAIPTTPGIPVSGNSEYTPSVGTFVYGTQYVFYVRSDCGSSIGTGKWAGPYSFALKPLNDDCAQAMPVAVNPDTNCTNSVNGSIIGATDSPQILGCSGGGTKDDDVWFEFVATSTTHTITLSNISGNGEANGLFHALYAGSDCSTMVWKYCNFANPNMSVAQNLVIGQTYKIRVWSFTSTPNQTTSFKLCITTPPAPPANDNCTNAIAVTVNPTLECAVLTAGTTYSATESSEGTTCTGGKDDDVWYTFVATNPTHRIIFQNVAGSTTVLNHVVYSGNNCSSLTQLYCSQSNNSWANGLTVGQTYYIRVYTNTTLLGQTTTFNLCVSTPPPPPANDECATATIVPVNTGLVCEQIVHGTIASATASPEANTCANSSDDDDVWFQFTATGTKHFIELKNVVGNMPDLYHVLYSGSQCGTLTQLYCSDANYSIATGLTIGQVYKIRVYSVSNNKNLDFAFDVCITSPIAPPVNDECSTAIVIPVNNDPTCTLSASGNVYGATASPEVNTCGSAGSADDDIWYEFTATHETHLISLSNISGSATALYVSIYSGECGSLTKINNCTTAVESIASGLIVGAVYKIRVFTSATTPNQTTSFNICVRIPNAPVTVDAVSYTPEQLVRNVLFNTPCASISNITSSSGTDFGDVPSIGYFEAPSAAYNGFPFHYGVVLGTSDVNLAKGPYNTLGTNAGFNSYTWLGDNDLNALIESYDALQASKTMNATVLEFDFIPLINKFEFDFLFASTEYGLSPCNYSDAFAFILTDENGVSKNLAVIPNTNIPVSATTIRDGVYAPNCGSANVEYFGQYNATQPLLSAINFHGQTKELTASAIVVPGQTYHIKLVIADYADPKNASAVFLGGGTFDIGTLDLGADLLVATKTAICDTGSAIIDTQLPANEYTFEWFKDGSTISGATQPAYEVTEPGTYGVIATLEGIECSFEGSKIVEQYPLVTELTGNPVNITACDAAGFHTFDLTSNVDALLSLPTDPENYTVSIHLTEQDAKDNVNAIDPAVYSTFTNTVQGLQTLWTRSVYSETGCFGIKSFDLIIQDLTPQYTIDSDFSICDGTSDTIDVVITDTDPNPVTYTWIKDGNLLADTTPSITVTEAGAYTVVLDRTGCTATSTVNVAVTPIPVADAPTDVTVCESYELPALSANNTYYDAATNAVVAPGTVISVNTIFNVVASSGTIPECTSQNTFTVTIIPSPVVTAPADQTVCETYLLPQLTEGGNYYTGPGKTGILLNAGEEITVSQTIYVYKETGLVPNCWSEASFEVTIITKPLIDTPSDVNVCDSYELPALTAGNYYTGTNGSGEVLPAGYIITASQPLYVFADNGVCTNEHQFNVNITPSPAFSLGEDRIACVPSNVIITITDTNFTDANNPSYSWTVDGTPVSGGSSITASVFGTYEVTVTVGNCSHSESIEVEENNTPVELIIADGCENGVYMIEVSPENDSFDTETATYSWTGPGTFVSDKREFAATAIGEYFVTVTTAEGCIGEDSIVVSSTSCTIQKGISPNNDNLNDSFDLSELMVKHLSIFNRYGEEVYSKDNYKNEWVGQTNSGKELPTGTYFYMIELTGGESKTGWIYINRQD